MKYSDFHSTEKQPGQQADLPYCHSPTDLSEPQHGHIRSWNICQESNKVALSRKEAGFLGHCRVEAKSSVCHNIRDVCTCAGQEGGMLVWHPWMRKSPSIHRVATAML